MSKVCYETSHQCGRLCHIWPYGYVSATRFPS